MLHNVSLLLLWLHAGITVVPAVVDPSTNKVKSGQAFVHRAFISTIYADAPFRAKILFLVGGFTGLLVCVFCRLTGSRKGPGKGTMRYLGYDSASTAAAGPGAGRQFQLGVDDGDRVYSSEEMQMLVEAAEHLRQQGREKDAQQQTGFHGMSPLLRCLPYQDVRTVSVVPFMHAYLQGVLKDWLRGFFVSPNKPQPQRTAGMAGSSLPGQRQPKRQRGSPADQQHTADDEPPQQQPQQQAGQFASPAMLLAPEQRASMPMRKVVSARCKGFKGGLHPQQNRPVSDIVKLHAGLTFEELANGVRGIFAHLFWPVRVGNRVAEVLADPLVAEAYGCLRAFGHFHLTEGSWRTWQEYEAAVDQAQKHILRYGAIAERVSLFLSLPTPSAVSSPDSADETHSFMAVCRLLLPMVVMARLPAHNWLQANEQPVAAVLLLQDFTADKDPAVCNAAACTYNLHSLSCQLAAQAKDRGHTVHWLEDWVERDLGRLCGRTRGRVVRDPAHVAASVELDDRAIQTAAVWAGVQLGDDATMVGLAVRQSDIDAALAAPSVAATCRVLGDPQSFPHVVAQGQAALRWQDVAVGTNESPLRGVTSESPSEMGLSQGQHV